MNKAIEIENVNKSYGDVRALEDVNLTIEQGEFFGLLGPNGAGKSTLIGVLGGLVNKDSGQVTVLGNDVVQNYRKTKKSLGIVPQEVVFDPYFNVRETLEIQSGYFGVKDNGERIDEVLDALGLKYKEDTNIRGLSGGMKRRLLIAKALVHDPDIIVLDEPTAGVDVELRKSLWDYVIKLNEQGKTIILTTHYLEEAEQLCDRIAILNKGRVVAVDQKEELIKRIDKKVIEVKLQHKPNNIEELFPTAANIEWTDTNKLKLETTRGNVISLLDKIQNSSLEIVDIDVNSAKLEDVFMKLTSLGGEENE
ncbi:ATP-binding cassette domain-containing protein [Halanaerobacter jeridensis]|uniref:ABC-2 type transport system ATP-binding protein n=1 Tax=Halanaerobacter jeridensis TaxID=706427 RepID=A0A938XYE4_9FIRM|nr:ABC-2 type transport system ATP-binding protein [Halanaerobacter jeridensis]